MLMWQTIATLAIAAIGAITVGSHGAWSALFGGFINVAANGLYGLAYGLMRPAGPGGEVIAAVRAEASKILLVMLLLFAVLVVYQDLVPAAFLASFVLTALLFRLVLIVRD
jgi:ATP synthase protein I